MTTTYKQVKNILSLTLFLNLLVAVIKLLWGRWTNSLSMQADGFHSLFDGASNIIGLVGIWAARHPPDDCHPYGHKKFETFAAFGISVFLFVTCFSILENSYARFQTGVVPDVPGLSFLIMLATMGINLFVTWYEQKQAVALKSGILQADSMHTLSDVYSSLTVLIGLAAVRLGLPILDSIMAVAIAGFIGRTGFKILFESSRVLSDASRVDPRLVKEVVMQVPGVKSCHSIRTRGLENHVFVDCHIYVQPDMTADKTHDLVHEIEDLIKKEMSEVVDVVIHVEPDVQHTPHAIS
ncbi:MAG TPA: cation diffusion facilitator family transporter [Nitrospiria bacterium]|jgi:cation diffusion facilitator family transporter|nr:cation diffusion facilitator family transporter [Nitrospiria bacterium]